MNKQGELVDFDLNLLSERWIEAKEDERIAQESRRAIEDRIKYLTGIEESLDGTVTLSRELYTIKVVGRIDRKVDSEKVQELAAEHGLTEHLPNLFRWRPEVNVAAWKSAAESITKLLEPAITTKPGRPSFTITRKE